MVSKNDFPPTMGKVAPRELIQNGIKNLDATTEHSEKELLAIHGVGPKAVRIIKEELAKMGKSLNTTSSNPQSSNTDKPKIYSMSVACQVPQNLDLQIMPT